MPKSILIVDDERDMLQLLQRTLTPDLQCHIETAESSGKALEILEQRQFDLILADIKMPDMDGLELLDAIKMENREQTIVMMTAYGSVDTAVEAIRKGAYDFITKPFDHDTLIVRLEKALERSQLIKENLFLQQQCRGQDIFHDMVGKSKIMNKLYENILMVAKTDLTVLVTGESGTGKELAARAVHDLSSRSRMPFVAVNCPAVPENILESELFGYKKGAFTHASQNRIGLFQEANTGTIFLDEIGDINPTIQTKLLRVLQEKEIKPLGDTKSIHVDVRIIASTNQPLEEKIKNNEFREDFYYRLNVLPVKLPALREHPEDIPLIANHLLARNCERLKKPLKKIAPELMEQLVGQRWEGNVRELENVIVQGISFCGGEVIQLNDVDLGREKTSYSVVENPYEGLSYKEAKERTLKDFNYNYIAGLLSVNHGNISAAARQCGLERQALQQIMRRYGIKAEPFRTT
jgi:DNA-binding NtrC family response regulator